MLAKLAQTNKTLVRWFCCCLLCFSFEKQLTEFIRADVCNNEIHAQTLLR